MYQNNSIEMVDRVFLEWLREDLRLHSDTFDGWSPVPVVWGKQERSYQAKSDKNLRDADGALVLPIISVWRSGLSSSLDKKGGAVNPSPSKPGAKGSSLVVYKEVNQEKTTDFKRKDFYNKTNGLEQGKAPFSSKTVYDIYSIEMPVYSTFTYKVRIEAQFQQQLNQILQPLLNYGYGHKYFTIHKYDHTLEVFPEDDFEIPDDDVSDDSRIFETECTFVVLANTSGDGDNSNKPKLVRSESVVEVRLGDERRITDDQLKSIMKNGIKLKG